MRDLLLQVEKELKRLFPFVQRTSLEESTQYFIGHKFMIKNDIKYPDSIIDHVLPYPFEKWKYGYIRDDDMDLKYGMWNPTVPAKSSYTLYLKKINEHILEDLIYELQKYEYIRKRDIDGRIDVKLRR